MYYNFFIKCPGINFYFGGVCFAGQPDTRIVLKIEFLDLEKQNECSYDFLELRDAFSHKENNRENTPAGKAFPTDERRGEDALSEGSKSTNLSDEEVGRTTRGDWKRRRRRKSEANLDGNSRRFCGTTADFSNR